MKTYDVLDPSLRSVSQGKNTYPVVDGKIELPEEIASEFLGSGQIGNASKVSDSVTEKPMTAAEKRAFAKAAKEAAAKLDGE